MFSHRSCVLENPSGRVETVSCLGKTPRAPGGRAGEEYEVATDDAEGVSIPHVLDQRRRGPEVPEVPEVRRLCPVGGQERTTSDEREEVQLLQSINHDTGRERQSGASGRADVVTPVESRRSIIIFQYSSLSKCK